MEPLLLIAHEVWAKPIRGREIGLRRVCPPLESYPYGSDVIDRSKGASPLGFITALPEGLRSYPEWSGKTGCLNGTCQTEQIDSRARGMFSNLLWVGRKQTSGNRIAPWFKPRAI